MRQQSCPFVVQLVRTLCFPHRCLPKEVTLLPVGSRQYGDSCMQVVREKCCLTSGNALVVLYFPFPEVTPNCPSFLPAIATAGCKGQGSRCTGSRIALCGAAVHLRRVGHQAGWAVQLRGQFFARSQAAVDVQELEQIDAGSAPVQRLRAARVAQLYRPARPAAGPLQELLPVWPWSRRLENSLVAHREGAGWAISPSTVFVQQRCC